MDLGFYKHGIRLKCKGRATENLPVRGMVSFFSEKSRRRLGWVYAQGDWKSMVTLTYHQGVPAYPESKKHLNAFLGRLRVDGIRYLWVVEFQLRGSPHYHIWLDRELPGPVWRKYMKTWLRVTTAYNGDRKAIQFHLHEAIYTKWDVRLNLNYAKKYADKLKQKALPVGVNTFGRWWGRSRDLVIDPQYSISVDQEERTVTVNTGSSIVCQRFSSEALILFERHVVRFRRNVRRSISAWGRRRRSRRTMQGFSFVLVDHRLDCMKRLLESSFLSFEAEAGILLHPSFHVLFKTH